MLDGLKVRNAAYGIYHPDYDLHVYRDIELDNVTAEPINGGHDDDSLADGDFTYERLTFRNCRLGRDPLVQLTHRAAKPGLSGHFRGIVVINSVSNDGVVNFGGGPRTNRVDNPVRYYFHDWPAAGEVTRVISERSLDIESRGDFRIIDGWTGGEAAGWHRSGCRLSPTTSFIGQPSSCYPDHPSANGRQSPNRIGRLP